jgi:hypothetical protein
MLPSRLLVSNVNLNDILKSWKHCLAIVALTSHDLFVEPKSVCIFLENREYFIAIVG